MIRSGFHPPYIAKTGIMPSFGQNGQKGAFQPAFQEDEKTQTWKEALNNRDLKKLKSLLLEGRAAINARNSYGETALIQAIPENNYELVELLLKAGADVNVRNNSGQTAILHAIRYSDDKMVKLLIEQGASLNVTSTYGETPMQWVARKNKWQLFQSLLVGKANLEWCAFGQHTPLGCAAEAGHSKMVDLLLKAGAKVGHTNSRNYTALHVAAEGGFPAVVKLLLSAGASIDAATDRLETPLMLAASKGMGQTVRLLLDKGANVNLKDTTGATVLAHAVRGGNPQILETILSHPNLKRNAEGLLDPEALNEAFTTAITSTNHHAFSRLMSYKPNIEFCRPKSQFTPLMHAVSLINTGLIIDQLLKHGANVNALDKEGLSPLHYILSRQSGNGPEQTEIALTLLAYGADPNQKNKYGQTPLFLAIYQGLDTVIEALINKGADLNVKNSDGMTPLHAAAFMGKPKLLEMLLSRGADPNVKNNFGVTPRAWIQATGMMYENYDDLYSIDFRKDIDGSVRMLKQYGAEDDAEALKKAYEIEESKYLDSYADML